MVNINIIMNIILVIFILLGISLIFFGIQLMNVSSGLIAYLRKNNKKRIKDFILVEINKSAFLSFFKILPWADKDQNEVINPIKWLIYVYNHEDITDQKILDYKKRVKKAMTNIFVVILLILLFMLIPLLFT